MAHFNYGSFTHLVTEEYSTNNQMPWLTWSIFKCCLERM